MRKEYREENMQLKVENMTLRERHMREHGE